MIHINENPFNILASFFFMSLFPSPNSFLSARDGEFLRAFTILKTDEIPSPSGTRISFFLPELPVSGARNFRQFLSWPVYGVSQPTLWGVRTVLNYLRKNQVGREKERFCSCLSSGSEVLRFSCFVASFLFHLFFLL